MKKALLGLLIGTAGLGMALAADNPAPAKDQTKTLVGEVLDMSCFVGHGAKGEKHKKCALECLQGGAPAGLLTDDGQVYLLIENHEKPKPFAALKKLGGEKASVTGKLFQQGGLQAVLVDSAEKSK